LQFTQRFVYESAFLGQGAVVEVESARELDISNVHDRPESFLGQLEGKQTAGVLSPGELVVF